MVGQGVISIDRASCLLCAACPPACHSEALQLHGLKLELNHHLCDNCLACIAVCPVGAISHHNTNSKSLSAENRRP